MKGISSDVIFCIQHHTNNKSEKWNYATRIKQEVICTYFKGERGGDIAFHETGRKQDQQNDTEIDRQGKTTSRRPISHRTWKELLQNVKRSMRGVGITVIQRVVRKGELRTKVDWVAQKWVLAFEEGFHMTQVHAMDDERMV